MLYHCVPRGGFHGEKLHPLSVLKVLFPIAYDWHVGKYYGRMDVLETHIPTLNCGWSDVVFLSPVHPTILVGAWRRTGVIRNLWSMEFLEFLPEALVPDLATVWMYTDHNAEDASQYRPYVPSQMSGMSTLPEQAGAYFRTNQESAFRFAYIPHVLYRGSLNIRDAKIVRV